MNMKTLYLPLKKEWYDMIESGEKTEEYREIKPYWWERLLKWELFTREEADFLRSGRSKTEGDKYRLCDTIPAGYTHVRFSYGYTKRTMTYKCKGITIGKGKPEWGAPENENVFIIKLGNRI